MTIERDPRMFDRRRVLLNSISAALALGAVPMAPAWADAETDRASSFIKDTGDKLVAVINGSGSAQQKRQELARIIDQRVDVDGVARFCLGRYWRQATADQQKRYLEAFRQVLTGSILVRLGDYQGVRFVMGRAVPEGEAAKVSTVIERPNNPPAMVDWIVASPESNPKIIDMLPEGTSLRITQRSDYSSYLTHNNNDIDALIGAMHQQVTQNHASG